MLRKLAVPILVWCLLLAATMACESGQIGGNRKYDPNAAPTPIPQAQNTLELVNNRGADMMVKIASSLDSNPCVPMNGEFTIDVTLVAPAGWILLNNPLQDPLHYTVTDFNAEGKVAVTVRGGGPYWLQPTEPIIASREETAKAPWGTTETFKGPGDYFTYTGQNNGSFCFKPMGGGYATPLHYSPQ